VLYQYHLINGGENENRKNESEKVKPSLPAYHKYRRQSKAWRHQKGMAAAAWRNK